MIKIIAAMGLDRSIGLNDGRNELPWQGQDVAKGDLERFSELTKDGVVIMGRRTWDSIGGEPLKGRINYVIATKRIHTSSGIYKTLAETIEHAKENHPDKNIFLIGGERIFRDGQRFAQEIDLTILPYKGYNNYESSSLVYFPEINTKIFRNRSSFIHPNNSELRILRYWR